MCWRILVPAVGGGWYAQHPFRPACLRSQNQAVAAGSDVQPVVGGYHVAAAFPVGSRCFDQFVNRSVRTQPSHVRSIGPLGNFPQKLNCL